MTWAKSLMPKLTRLRYPPFKRRMDMLFSCTKNTCMMLGRRILFLWLEGFRILVWNKIYRVVDIADIFYVVGGHLYFEHPVSVSEIFRLPRVKVRHLLSQPSLQLEIGFQKCGLVSTNLLITNDSSAWKDKKRQRHEECILVRKVATHPVWPGHCSYMQTLLAC